MRLRNIIKIIILIIVVVLSKDNTTISYKLDNNIKYNSTINNYKEYIMYIEIPKIKLYKGLYNIDNKKNNVKYNIEILKKSSMPNIINSNLILAAHSGNGRNAFFNNLKELTINDEVYIYYDNKKYIYIIKDIYTIDKTGKASIKENINKNSISLITCSTIDKTKQIIYYGEIKET